MGAYLLPKLRKLALVLVDIKLKMAKENGGTYCFLWLPVESPQT